MRNLVVKILPTIAISLITALPALAAQPLTKTILSNGTFEVPTVSEAGSEAVLFKNGKAKWGECSGELSQIATGDLNGDGIADGAFVFGYSSGGSGYFTSLCVFIAGAKGPELVGSRSLGDRSRIDSLTISHGETILKMLGHAPDDSASMPSLKKTAKFKVQKHKLVGPENLQ